MVVGIDGGHVEWTPLRHRHFPLDIREAIVTLLLAAASVIGLMSTRRRLA